MLTESRNPNTTKIDQLSTLEMLTVINEEDARVAGAVRQALPQIAQAVDAISARMRDGGRLIYTGAGTSGRLGVLDAVECVPTFSAPPGLVIGLIAGGEKALTQAAEGAEDNVQAGKDALLAINLAPNDSVVGIAASGRTPYVIGALQTANDIGAFTVAVTCNANAPMLEHAQVGIVAEVGAEVITGSTRLKSGTAQKLILNMLSTAVMIKLGKVYGNLMVDVMVTNEKLADRARRIVVEVTGISYEEANKLLIQTDNHVKTAIVMALKNATVEEAQRQLEANQGVLAQIITPTDQA
ncbi:MAG: N-acetylmuramic acid 6-phosphate etherase [Aggregatilineales bacterium]